MEASIVDACGLARVDHGPDLLTGTPRCTVRADKHEGVARLPATRVSTKSATLRRSRQHAGALPAFRLPNKHSSRVGIEIARAKAGGARHILHPVKSAALTRFLKSPWAALISRRTSSLVKYRRRGASNSRKGLTVATDIGIDLAITKCPG